MPNIELRVGNLRYLYHPQHFQFRGRDLLEIISFPRDSRIITLRWPWLLTLTFCEAYSKFRFLNGIVSKIWMRLIHYLMLTRETLGFLDYNEVKYAELFRKEEKIATLIRVSAGRNSHFEEMSFLNQNRDRKFFLCNLPFDIDEVSHPPGIKSLMAKLLFQCGLESHL